MALPRAADANQDNWGHGELELMNGWVIKATNTFATKAVGSYSGSVVYCVEPGVSLFTGNALFPQDESYWDNYPPELNSTIPGATIKQWISRILIYGYQGSNNSAWNSANIVDREEISQQIATQLLIWETVVGERDADFNKIDAAAQGKSNVLDTISPDHPCYANILAWYGQIEIQAKAHGILPSFMSASIEDAPEWTLIGDGSGYSAELEDSNKVVGSFSFSCNNPDIKFSVADNTLSVSSNNPVPNPTVVKAVKSGVKQGGVIVWGDDVLSADATGQLQDVVGYAETGDIDISAFCTVAADGKDTEEAELGQLKIIKTTQDGPVSGFSFRVTGPDAYDWTFVTDESGEILIADLAVGGYTVSEVRDKVSANYIIPASQIASVADGQVVVVTMHNAIYEAPKTGDNRMLSTWLTLSAMSIAGMVILARIARRGKARIFTR